MRGDGRTLPRIQRRRQAVCGRDRLRLGDDAHGPRHGERRLAGHAHSRGSLAAFYLRVRTGTLTLAQAQQAERLFRPDLQTLYHRVPSPASILNQAMHLVTVHPLCAYDAVQLAAALHFQARELAAGRPPPTFLYADLTLNRAAVAEGMLVDDPNHHP